MQLSLSVGDSVYVLVVKDPPPNRAGPFNADNYEAREGRVVDVNDAVVKVTLSDDRTIETYRALCFPSEGEAMFNNHRAPYYAARDQSICRLLTNPPENLIANIEARFTSNPLRYGETNRVFGAQANTWGDKANAQKIIQIIGFTIEDIEMIVSALDVLVFASDYAKKLLGKYMLIELESLYTLLVGTNSSSSHGLREFNPEYAKNEFVELEMAVAALRAKYDVLMIRDKLAAHKDSNLDVVEYTRLWRQINKDSLMEYWELLFTHIDKVLQKYYPWERTQYLITSGALAVGIRQDPAPDYVPFDDVAM